MVEQTDADTPSDEEALVDAVVEAIDSIVSQRTAALRRVGSRAEAMDLMAEGERLVAAVTRHPEGESEQAPDAADNEPTQWVTLVRALGVDGKPAPGAREWLPVGYDDWDMDSAVVRIDVVRSSPPSNLNHYWTGAFSSAEDPEGVVTVVRDEHDEVLAVVIEGTPDQIKEAVGWSPHSGTALVDAMAIGSQTLTYALGRRDWLWWHGDTPSDWPLRDVKLPDRTCWPLRDEDEMRPDDRR